MIIPTPCDVKTYYNYNNNSKSLNLQYSHNDGVATLFIV